MRYAALGIFVLGLMLACAVPGRDDDVGGDDQDVGADTGDTRDTDEGAEGAEGAEVAEACQAYLACLAAVDPEAFAASLSTYGEGGSCWESDTLAESCVTACETGFSEMSQLHPDDEVCATEWPPALDDIWSFEQVSAEGSCTDAGSGLELTATWFRFESFGGGDYALTGQSNIGIGFGYVRADFGLWCTHIGDTVSCPEEAWDPGTDVFLTFSGVHGSGGIEAVLDVRLGSGDGTCTDHVTMWGER